MMCSPSESSVVHTGYLDSYWVTVFGVYLSVTSVYMSLYSYVDTPYAIDSRVKSWGLMEGPYLDRR